jgi:hypothetical protein
MGVIDNEGIDVSDLNDDDLDNIGPSQLSDAPLPQTQEMNFTTSMLRHRRQPHPTCAPDALTYSEYHV